MSFTAFLGGAARIVVGWGLCLFGCFLGLVFLTGGYIITGSAVLVLSVIAGLYAEYHRGRQPQRMHGGAYR